MFVEVVVFMLGCIPEIVEIDTKSPVDSGSVICAEEVQILVQIIKC